MALGSAGGTAAGDAAPSAGGAAGVGSKPAVPIGAVCGDPGWGAVCGCDVGEGQGLVDKVLGQQGLARRVALRVPHFYSALAIVAKSDLILTAPAALATLVPPDLRIVALPPPLRLPWHSVDLVWHERFSKDPGHGWLRGLIAEITRVMQR